MRPRTNTDVVGRGKSNEEEARMKNMGMAAAGDTHNSELELGGKDASVYGSMLTSLGPVFCLPYCGFFLTEVFTVICDILPNVTALFSHLSCPVLLSFHCLPLFPATQPPLAAIAL